MKKLICVLTILVFIVSTFSACMPTPDVEYVGNKGDSTMKKALEIDGVDPQALSIPSEYLYKDMFLGDRVEITIDARVDFTSNDSLPVYSAKIKPYTEQTIELIVNQMFGPGSELSRNDIPMSKSELIEKLLIPAQEQLAIVQSGVEVYDETGLVTEASLINRINSIKAQIAEAPDKVERVAVSINEYQTSPTGIQAHATLPDGDEASIWVTNGQDIYPIWLIFELKQRQYDEYANRSLEDIGLSTTQEEAIRMAQNLIDELGINYMDFSTISSTSLLGADEYENSSQKNLGTKAYAITFTRTVDGIRCAYDDHFCENTYSKPFDAERIRIHVDDKGIAGIYWYGNTVISNTVRANVQLSPFDEMIVRGASQLGQKSGEYFAVPFDNGIRKIEYHIDRIAIGYTRILDKDTQDGFLLIPVWDFYGEQKIIYDESYIDKQNSEYNLNSPYTQVNHFDAEPIVTINAIDGTIIDRSLGY